MALGFFTGLAGLIWSKLGLLVGALAWLVSSVVLATAKFFAHLLLASFPVYLPWWGVVLVYVAIIWFLYYLRKKTTQT